MTSGITIVCVLASLGLASRTRIRNGSVSLLRHDASGWTAETVDDLSWARRGGSSPAGTTP